MTSLCAHVTGVSERVLACVRARVWTRIRLTSRLIVCMNCRVDVFEQTLCKFCSV